MANPRQTHNLQVRVGGLKPGSGQARMIATGNSGSGSSHNMNTNPKPGAARVGPSQLGNQGTPSKPAAPNVQNINGTRTPRGRRPA